MRSERRLEDIKTTRVTVGRLSCVSARPPLRATFSPCQAHSSRPKPTKHSKAADATLAEFWSAKFIRAFASIWRMRSRVTT